ncbi:MAG: TraB/GumN family protein [Brevinematales bacterium]|jgi:pheromone shutdown-related protein TraB
MENKTENLSPNCMRIQAGDKDIYILGTAHVLAESRKEVEELIDTVNPDSVCVELCESRYQSLKDKNRWKNLDIIKVIRQGKGFLLLVNMILSAFQKRVGVEMESAPGDEMITAFRIAEEKNKNVVLADRDINVTLRRAWKLSSFWDKMKILAVLMEALFTDEDFNKEDVSELLNGEDMLNEMMRDFANKLPKVKGVIIDERDLYLAHHILTAGGNKIVAVVGKGHLKGIQAAIEKRTDYDPAIETVPPSGIGAKLIPWAIGLAVLALLALGFMKGSSVGVSMLWAWVLASGLCTSLAALAVIAHPVTIIAAWIAGPVKLIAPPLSAGILLAPLEAILRKPQVKDLENLNNDIQTLRGFFSNRVTKILVVFAAVTIGAIIGHTIALVWIAKILAAK